MKSRVNAKQCRLGFHHNNNLNYFNGGRPGQAAFLIWRGMVCEGTNRAMLCTPKSNESQEFLQKPLKSGIVRSEARHERGGRFEQQAKSSIDHDAIP
jgi:hypothetical protein